MQAWEKLTGHKPGLIGSLGLRTANSTVFGDSITLDRVRHKDVSINAPIHFYYKSVKGGFLLFSVWARASDRVGAPKDNTYKASPSYRYDINENPLQKRF